MSKPDEISVLLLDDNKALVDLYKKQLEKKPGFIVTTATDGLHAQRLADKQLFDIVVIDAKLDYRGLEFGGLRLADDLRRRYGTNSIIIVSQYITADLMRDHGSQFAFLDKARDTADAFIQNLRSKMQEMRQQQHVFVAMPFDGRLISLYSRHIKPAIEDCGFVSVRLDQMDHSRPIHEVMFDILLKSKLVMFLADGGNPNAYYEAGFADALNKEVIVIAKSIKELKFDVQDRPTITYKDTLQKLRTTLSQKIDSMRLAAPIGI